VTSYARRPLCLKAGRAAHLARTWRTLSNPSGHGAAVPPIFSPAAWRFQANAANLRQLCGTFARAFAAAALRLPRSSALRASAGGW